MTVNIPQKAGFVPTPEEWAQLVRIAENLAAQVVQRDQANMKITFDTQEKFNQLSGDLYEAHTKAAQIQAERDAARAEVVKLRSDLSLARDEYSAANDDAHKWAALANEKANERDAARAEVARLLLLITGHNANAETTCKRWQAEGYCVTAGYDIRCNECPQEWTIDALRQPAPEQDDDAREAMIEILEDEPAPAHGQE